MVSATPRPREGDKPTPDTVLRKRAGRLVEVPDAGPYVYITPDDLRPRTGRALLDWLKGV
jgi:hypothetical protein